MDKKSQIHLLMDNWKTKHQSKNYERFISDGIVNFEEWEKQSTPRVCYFLKEAYTDNPKGYNLTESLRNNAPWGMWKKVAIWTNAIFSAFQGNIPYNEKYLKENQTTAIDKISIVNVKKSNGGSNSDYEDIKRYAIEDCEEIKSELKIISPDIIVCGNISSLLKIVLSDEMDTTNMNDSMIGKWGNKLIIDYYHPAIQYANRVNYYALSAIVRTAIELGYNCNQNAKEKIL